MFFTYYDFISVLFVRDDLICYFCIVIIHIYSLLMKASRLLFLSLLLCLHTVHTFAFDDTELKKQIAEFNQTCPVSLGNIGEITGVYYDNGTVTMLFTISEVYMDLRKIASIPDKFKSMMEVNLTQMQASSRILFNMLVDANATLVTTFKGNTTGAEVSAEFSTDEIRDILNNKNGVTPLDKLNSLIEMTKMQFPIEVEEGITATDLYWKDNDVIFVYSVDETLCNVYAIGVNADEIKINMSSSIISTPTAKRFIQAVTGCEKGLIYRYKGSATGYTADIVFSPEELKGIVN